MLNSHPSVGLIGKSNHVPMFLFVDLSDRQEKSLNLIAIISYIVKKLKTEMFSIFILEY